jgi:phospholipid/cholesterol/gamma-HCH transport system substrate-binding protein
MKPKVRYTLVGAFVILLSAALVSTMLWLGFSATERTYEPYVTYLSESVSGLTVGAMVSYNGVEVGRVRAIALDEDNPSQVRVDLNVLQGTPVVVDTVATLNSSGITGVSHIQLSGGTAESTRLRPARAGDIPEIPSRASTFVRIEEQLTGLVGELTAAANSLSDVGDRVESMLNDENLGSIGTILANVSEFTEDMHGVSSDVRTLTRSVTEVADRIPAVVTRAERTLAAFEYTARVVGELGEDIQTVVQVADGTMGDVSVHVERFLSDMAPLSRGVPGRIVGLMDELQLLAGNLRRFTGDVERNPEMLVFGRRNTQRGPGE